MKQEGKFKKLEYHTQINRCYWCGCQPGLSWSRALHEDLDNLAHKKEAGFSIGVIFSYMLLQNSITLLYKAYYLASKHLQCCFTRSSGRRGTSRIWLDYSSYNSRSWWNSPMSCLARNLWYLKANTQWRILAFLIWKKKKNKPSCNLYYQFEYLWI